MTTASFPALGFLLDTPSRYKVLHGGRGGGKSWGIARALLILGWQKPLRVLCAREFMASISDSVHRLLSDQISDLGLDGFYSIEKASIKGANGTEFRFAGIRTNVQQIKSFEGVDIAWCEEAANVSKHSFETLIPTIRKEGSEIWISLNPELPTDYCYQQFVANPPPNALVAQINFSDNPWFPKVLRDEMELLAERDPDAYQNIWLGKPRQFLDGAVYASELRDASADGRITHVPYDRSKPVHTFWDLGFADNTSIWFAQVIGFEYRIIDHLTGTQRPLQAYLTDLQARGYVYGTDYLPHDARAKQLGSGRSIEELMVAAGRKVHLVPNIGLESGINAARTIFPNCWFDEEKCADGLQSLRHYRYEMVEDKMTGAQARKQLPLHDFASHSADAFRYLAVSIRGDKPKTAAPRQQPPSMRSKTEWMRM